MRITDRTSGVLLYVLLDMFVTSCIILVHNKRGILEINM